jgi:hypothetical protein
MANLVSKAYDALDDAIMYGANKVVRAWNWTTGKTKADLANLTIVLAGTLNVAGTYAVNPSDTGLAVLICFMAGKGTPKLHNEIENREERAFYSNCKDIYVEAWKDRTKYLGPAFSLIGGAAAGIACLDPKIKYSERVSMDLFGIFMGSFSVAGYIMRTDYLPPRKDAFSRGVDKLVELWNQTAPAHQPI